jgi:hypothetical protein
VLFQPALEPRGQFPAPPIKFPAPLKKFPAPASREFVCKPLISQRFLRPESPEKALFSKNSLLNSLLPGNLALRPVVSICLLSHGVGLCDVSRRAEGCRARSPAEDANRQHRRLQQLLGPGCPGDGGPGCRRICDARSGRRARTRPVQRAGHQRQCLCGICAGRGCCQP